MNADSPIEVHGKYFPQLDEMRKLMIGVRIEIELSIKQPQKTLRRFNVILDENDKSNHPEKLRKVIDELFPHEEAEARCGGRPPPAEHADHSRRAVP